jgi:gamma-glutamyl hydrolase
MFRRRVGILTMPAVVAGEGSKGRAFISESTVRWFAERGVDVVEIPYTVRASTVPVYMRKIHGLYLHGGPEYNSVYMATARRFLEEAVKANQRGQYFPVWGTCHGFQTMMMVFGGMVLDGTDLDEFDALDAHMTSLKVMPSARHTSRIFRAVDDGFLRYLTRECHILFANEHGITPRTFYSNRAISSMFRLLATARDARGKEMVAMVEARRFPFYGTQFHPEVVGSLEPFRAFFVHELMKNTNREKRRGTTKAFRERHNVRACTRKPSRIYRNSFVDTGCYFFD